MHIAEGILPAPYAAAFAVPAAVGVAVGLRAVKRQAKENPAFTSLVGLMGAAVFAISLMPIPVPVAGSVSHPAGTPLAAIVVGPAAAVLLGAVSLLLQALFFAHGGLTTLGANILSEGIAGSLVGFGVFVLARRLGLTIFLAGFLAGFLGDLAVYFTTATELSLGLFSTSEAWTRLWPIFLAFLPTQLPLAVVEGFLTGGVLRSLAELRPDVAKRLGIADGVRRQGRLPRVRKARHAWGAAARRTRIGLTALAAAALAVAGWALVWTLASSAGSWVGLDEGVMEATAEQAGRPAWQPFINTDVGDLLLYVFFAGALLAGGIIGWLVRGWRPLPVAAEHVRRPWVARALAVGSGLVALLVLWAALFPGLALGPVDGAGLRAAGDVLAHPTRRQVLGARGGDAVLFAFMATGLALGVGSGWVARRRVRGVRICLPRLHVHHDVLATDRSTWSAGVLGGLDGRVKLAAVAVLLVVNLLVGWSFSLPLALFSLGILLVWQRVCTTVVLIRLAPALVVGTMLVLLRGFTVPGDALFSLDLTESLQVAFTSQGALAGAGQALVVLGGVSLMLLLGLTTPLPSLLGALRWYRVPELLIEIGLLMYRYLFLFVEEAGRLRQAQRLRGPDVPWRRAMGGFSSLGATLLIRSHDRSQRVYDAQRLRGGGSA